MSKTNEAVKGLVALAREIEYFAANVSFVTPQMVMRWADEIVDIAENEIGYD